jgi:hypothetical protein
LPTALSVAVLLLATPDLATAQGRGDPAAIQKRISQEIDAVIEELELTDEEAAITRTILLDGAEQRIELMREMRSAGGQFNREAMRESMETIDLATEDMLGEFLSEEKMREFREIRERRREEARARRGGRGRGPGSPRDEASGPGSNQGGGS